MDSQGGRRVGRLVNVSLLHLFKDRKILCGLDQKRNAAFWRTYRLIHLLNVAYTFYSTSISLPSHVHVGQDQSQHPPTIPPSPSTATVASPIWATYQDQTLQSRSTTDTAARFYSRHGRNRDHPWRFGESRGFFALCKFRLSTIKQLSFDPICRYRSLRIYDSLSRARIEEYQLAPDPGREYTVRLVVQCRSVVGRRELLIS
jgi:hypothetical protein